MWQFIMAAAGAASLAGAQPAPAPAPLPPAPPAEETLSYTTDRHTRMTVPITLGQFGPFRFVVDTGAERTVVSTELASRLALPAGRTIGVISLFDIEQVPTVFLPSLGVGRRSIEGINAPALAGRNLGADGLLGVDSLQNQRVVFDFARSELRLTPTAVREERWPSDTIVVTARSRFGRLILADATVDGQRVHAIVDTGSSVTIGNEALRRRLLRRGRLDPDQVFEVTSVTGNKVRVNYTTTSRIRFGTANIENLPIAFAGLELFRHLELEDRPAILLGMDALRLFRRVSIDFGARRLRLLPGPVGSSNAAPLRIAAAR